MPRRNRRWRDRSRARRTPDRRPPRPPRQPAAWSPSPHDTWLDPPDLPPPSAEHLPAALPRVCGACRERLELEGGRGRCLHPGSGFMYPYADTPACDFFSTLR